MNAKRVESPAEKPSASAVEGEMRDLVRGVAAARKAAEPSTEAADGVLPVIARIAAASLEEIDKLIGDLQDSRNYLQAEADRIQREAARYSELSDNALQAARIITQHLGSWRKPTALAEAPAAS
jgi:DNA repair exonuclease SbcCD ATPase subunit